jgi:hypothetical protein
LQGLTLVMIAACANNENIGWLDPDTGAVAGGAANPRRSTVRAVADRCSMRSVGGKGGQGQPVSLDASLEVLNFLPVEAADPFTGVITTGYGTPPGGGRAYRATILISDPALDARSLNVALQTRNGPVAAGTQRAVEDAILDRARQLRIQAVRF